MKNILILPATRLFFVLYILGFSIHSTSAQTDTSLLKEMQQQIQALQSRVTELEEKNTQLQTRLQQQEESVQTQAQQVQQIDEKVAQNTPADTKPAVRSSLGVDLYGYLKFDAAYDTGRSNTGDFARWVESDSVSKNDDEFNATANQSRFGLKFTGPDVGNMKSSGRVEVDFYGGGAENKANIMMSHAYAQLDWPDWDFSLLAGQTSDVISPLVPTTVNYTVGWWSGDTGYRRPQLRATKGFALTEDVRFQWETALTRTIGDGIFGLNKSMSGEDSGFPTLQGRASLSFPGLTENPTILGLSGHYGQEEIDLDQFDNSRDIDTWSTVLDWTVPLTEKLQVTGEAWMGENLDDYLGGIGQGIHGIDLDGNAANGAEYASEGIFAKGVWTALSIGPWGRLSYNVGGAIDDPDSNDLNAGQREQNMTLFGNVFCKVNDAILTAFEVAYIDTEYKNLLDGDSLRFQVALMYKF